MSVKKEDLVKVVVARTAQGDVQAIGVAVVYCDRPMVGIKLPDGSMTYWRADMAEIATSDELHSFVAGLVMK